MLRSLPPSIMKWATSRQNQQNGMCAQHRLRSAWASVQSDQSSLCAQWVAKDLNFFHADSKDSDQTGRMPRLIGVFAGCTCHFVGFVMRWLKSLGCLERATELPVSQAAVAYYDICRMWRSPINTLLQRNNKNYHERISWHGAVCTSAIPTFQSVWCNKVHGGHEL